MQEKCSDNPPQGWSSVWINILTLGLCLLISAVISTHATHGRQALMMLVPPCPANAFPQRYIPNSWACEIWDKTLTAFESVAWFFFFFFFFLLHEQSLVSHQQTPTRVMAWLVWSQTVERMRMNGKEEKFSTFTKLKEYFLAVSNVMLC